MQAVVTAQVRTFLVISSVLAVWMLLAAQPVQAHTTNLVRPSCSGLPADAFFTASPTATTPITAGGVVGSPAPAKQGTDLTDEGDRDFFYAKITVPALTAGELRVFDTGDGPSDAVLCHGRTTRVTSRTTYTHHDLSSTVTSAEDAAMKAGEAAGTPDAADVDTEAKARNVYNAARAALNTAASRLGTAASVLRRAANAAHTQAEKTAAGDSARTAELAGQTASEQHRTLVYETPTYPEGSTSAEQAELRRGAYNTARGNLATPLTTAQGALTTAVTALNRVASMDHLGFQIRADVQPDDRSYILVASANVAPTLAVAFHGAISSDGSLSGAFDAGKSDSTTIAVTAPGLLTLETTGTTDTMGSLDGSDAAEVAHADSGGSGGNFKMYAPVTIAALGTDENYTLYVEGQTDTISGDYGLEMDFQVAMGQIAALDETTSAITTGPDWGGTALDDDSFGSPAIQERSDTDYYVFTIADTAAGLLTVQAEDGSPLPASDTTGTLYGPPGVEIASATDGSGRHFRVRAPVQAMDTYAVEVSGTVGSYMLMVTLAEVENDTGASLPVTGTTTTGADGNCAANDAFEICPPTGRNPAEREQHLFEVTEAGAFYIHSTGGTDTIGTLFGPDGSQLATDDDSGPGSNFRLALNVTPGLYLLEVRGKAANTRGAYELVTNFVTGAEVEDPTDPVDPPDTTDPPPTTIDPDPTGSLDEPPPGSARSGIGIIRGWACQDDGNGVEIRIMNSDGTRAATFTAPYGSDRGDVDVSEHCGRRIDGVGFAVQFNYNLLAAGTYTIEAWVGRDQVGLSDGGQTNTFRVVRISNQEFLVRVQSGRIRVDDFPSRGDTTILEWDQQSQNFQIVDHQ